jgi:hypothetical protein
VLAQPTIIPWNSYYSFDTMDIAIINQLSHVLFLLYQVQTETVDIIYDAVIDPLLEIQHSKQAARSIP